MACYEFLLLVTEIDLAEIAMACFVQILLSVLLNNHWCSGVQSCGKIYSLHVHQQAAIGAFHMG